MKVILSIKPEFAKKIFDGTKKFEFRRTLFKKEVSKVVVYASAPISKVIGEFDIEDIVHEDVSTLWDKTSKYSGISLDYYFEYFQGKEAGYAIKVKNPTKYEEELCIVKNFGIRPPQSFAYMK